ncbi:glycosyltransferase [Sphingomonas montana]|uniref:glycosyltransferase n=1 Tax=Sphingomonas montana TaxID=1843236 RepID=UPI00096DE58F|nr:glycosyltransferase [Sphingomonas montana]
MDFDKGETDWGWSKLDAAQRGMVHQGFDFGYYAKCNPDIPTENVDLFRHYITEGWRQGRNPNTSFQTIEYILKHPELLGSGLHPFFHHLFPDAFAGETRDEAAPTPAEASAASKLPAIDFPALAGSIGSGSGGETTANLAAIRPLSVDEAFHGLSEGDIARLRTEFDSAYYLAENPEVRISGVEPFTHYMTVGWLERRNPSPDFSTKFYLDLYTDIANSGMNPFVHWALHGKKELRASISFRVKMARKQYAPKVSALVPNYNHGRFLAQRLDSILNQTYPDIEITVLDDCSSDNSREVIDEYAARYPGRIKRMYNETNSGGVFSQWRKGVGSADGELVWICESDDFCEPDFVAKLVPYFADDTVQMAFGRILETDIEGSPNLWLDTYREHAEAGIWDTPLVRPAADWFAHGFGVSNLIANVGGCLFRRAPVSLAVWQQAASYRVVGDWYLYLQIAAGGQIAWDPEAISYFRRHGLNTSSSSFTGTGFYTELERVMIEMRKTWDIPHSTVIKFYNNILEQYRYFKLESEHGPLDLHCNLDRMLAVTRQRGHILISMLGFVPGGGESFPIQLANSLVDAGWIVSMLIFVSDEVNVHMRGSLNPAISVYDAAWVTEYGCDRFIRQAGISLIHSHTVGAEMHFYHMWNLDPEIPYVVTLHGSYEASDIPSEMMARISQSVDHFVYTADKNLVPLENQGIAPDRFTKMANAMPIDPLPFPKTREDMGIAQNAVVFTLVARGIKRKGWRTAIEAFKLLRRRHPNRPMHLCLVGDGDEPDRHRKTHGNDPDISFLGYQSRIHGLYRMSDVAIVPTRFAGESYPLCIIQALQVGTPIVASDVGEISAMLRNDAGICGGVVMKAVRDTPTFVTAFADAMEAVLDDRLRDALREGARELGHKYDMTPLVETYGSLYSQVIGGAIGAPSNPVA